MHNHNRTLAAGLAIAIAIAAALYVAATAAVVATAATTSTAQLQHRETRQHRTITRDQGTLRFFRHHRWLLRAPETRPIATTAIRHARAELAWTHRELAETAQLIHARAVAAAAARARALEQADPIGYREKIVCDVFGADCAEALRVTHCEARGAWAQGHPETARNGQYHGAWQMGSRERALYGDSADFRGQTEAAHRYQQAAGWGRWSCA